MQEKTTLAASVTNRCWQDQPLPAPLISYEQAELVAIGLLRQRPETRALVGIGLVLVQQTLASHGVPTTLLALTGPALVLPSLVLQTDPQSAARFDALHARILSAPQPSDPVAAAWVRQRRLAHLRTLAMGSREARVFLPDVEAGWQPASPVPEPVPSAGRWVLQATPLLLGAGGALVAYIYHAGHDPALWPLLALPLTGALGFGVVLFNQLSYYRRKIAAAWLARPARLRPETVAVTKALGHRPWPLLYLPPLLLLVAFLVLIALLVAPGRTPTLGRMLWPVGLAYGLLLTSSYVLGRRYLACTRALVQGLPTSLLPAELNQLWQSFLYY